MSRCINVTFRKKREINNATKSQFNGGLKESVQLQSETETIKFNRTFYLRALEKTRNKWPRFHGFRRFFSVPKMFLLPLSPFSCIFSISFFLFFFFFFLIVSSFSAPELAEHGAQYVLSLSSKPHKNHYSTFIQAQWNHFGFNHTFENKNFVGKIQPHFDRGLTPLNYSV